MYFYHGTLCGATESVFPICRIALSASQRVTSTSSLPPRDTPCPRCGELLFARLIAQTLVDGLVDSPWAPLQAMRSITGTAYLPSVSAPNTPHVSVEFGNGNS